MKEGTCKECEKEVQITYYGDCKNVEICTEHSDLKQECKDYIPKARINE